MSYGGIDQEPIEMTGGLTQGDPESAILFNLANVPLNLALLNLETDQYYPIEHEMTPELANRNRLLTYSDDSCVILRFTSESIGNYIETVKSFTRVSGQTINEEKTKLIFSLAPNEN